jgi:hypothetical protein
LDTPRISAIRWAVALSPLSTNARSIIRRTICHLVFQDIPRPRIYVFYEVSCFSGIIPHDKSLYHGQIELFFGKGLFFSENPLTPCRLTVTNKPNTTAKNIIKEHRHEHRKKKQNPGLVYQVRPYPGNGGQAAGDNPSAFRPRISRGVAHRKTVGPPAVPRHARGFAAGLEKQLTYIQAIYHFLGTYQCVLAGKNTQSNTEGV